MYHVKKEINQMAAIVVLSATTAEGQLLQMIEAINNLQVVAVGAAAPGTTVFRVIQSNLTDDLTGRKNVTLQIPVNTIIGTDGLETSATLVY